MFSEGNATRQRCRLDIRGPLHGISRFGRRKRLHVVYYRVSTAAGDVVCHPAFELYSRLCRRYPTEAVEAICWLLSAQIEEAARMIWRARRVLFRLERL
jgi:anaerobic selenocysteine-containing dehydrogenase